MGFTAHQHKQAISCDMLISGTAVLKDSNSSRSVWISHPLNFAGEKMLNKKISSDQKKMCSN